MQKIRMGLQSKLAIYLVVLVSILCLFIGLFTANTVRKAISASIAEKAESDLWYAMELVELMYPGPWQNINGTLYKGQIEINNNADIINKIAEQRNTAITFFAGDTRVATSILSENRPHIGTKASDIVIQTVLETGKHYRGEVTILDTTYYAHYTPIRDTSGTVIGMVYVGIPQQYIAELERNFWFNFAWVVILGLIIVAILARHIGRKIAYPIVAMSKSAEELALGNLAIKEIAAPSNDEVGQLANAFNLMTNNLQIMLTYLKRHKIIADQARDIIIVMRPDLQIVDANNAALNAYGYSREELLCLNALDLRSSSTQQDATGQLKQAATSGLLFETIHRNKQGLDFPVEVNSIGVDIGKEKFLVSIVRDITKRKEIEEQLRYVSFHDPLTGLLNRSYFEEEMLRLKAKCNDTVGIIVCDVDGLKFVNDTLGHHSGDILLIEAANIIKSAATNSSIVARIGGDEIVILLPNSSDIILEEICTKIREAVHLYNSADPKIPLSLSVGWAIRRDDCTDIVMLFKEADNNMYREKLHRSQSTRSAIVQTLLKALQARDFATEGHADRLQDLAVELASFIQLPTCSISDLRLFAQFHDIGKVGIPDRILFKPDTLTPEEKLEMQRHSEIGHRIALSAPDLKPIADWILKHHERWDGTGYPLGLRNEEIPMECRILALIDSFDAMTSDRPYRKAMSIPMAITEIRRCSGSQFDPFLADKFIEFITLKNLSKKTTD